MHWSENCWCNNNLGKDTLSTIRVLKSETWIIIISCRHSVSHDLADLMMWQAFSENLEIKFGVCCCMTGKIFHCKKHCFLHSFLMVASPFLLSGMTQIPHMNGDIIWFTTMNVHMNGKRFKYLRVYKWE